MLLHHKLPFRLGSALFAIIMRQHAVRGVGVLQRVLEFLGREQRFGRQVCIVVIGDGERVVRRGLGRKAFEGRAGRRRRRLARIG